MSIIDVLFGDFVLSLCVFIEFFFFVVDIVIGVLF